MNPRLLGFVVLGGMVGTTVRAGLSAAFATPLGGWPVITFTVNISGAFVLGLLLQWLARTGPDEGPRRAARLSIGTGALGGYTTYSSFAVEVDRLIGSGHALLGAAYALVSIAAGLLAAGVGIALADRLTRGREPGA